MLAGAAVVLAAESVQSLIFPVDLTALDVGLWVIAASLIAAIGLVRDANLGRTAHRIDGDRRR